MYSQLYLKTPVQRLERAARLLGQVARLVDFLKERPSGPEKMIAIIFLDHVKFGLGMY